MYAEEMRFGFAGVDNSKNAGTDNSGDYSYGPDYAPGKLYTFDKFTFTIVEDGTHGGGNNQGIHHTDAPNFRLVKIFKDKVNRLPDGTYDTDKLKTNVEIQKVAMSTAFGANQSGLMDAFRDLYYYWTQEYPADAGENDCGDKYIVYLMGGIPDPKEFSHAIEWVNKLKQEGVITYVVALIKVGEPDAEETLAYANLVAEAGGGKCANDPDVFGPGYQGCAFVAYGGACDGANDPNCDVSGALALRGMLGTVLDLIKNQVTSRTRLATADAPLLATADGQWRINAYFQSFPGGGPWRGFLRAVKVNLAGDAIAQELEFDTILNQRNLNASPRTIYTNAADGSSTPEPLATALTTDPTLLSWALSRRTYYATNNLKCLADFFFGPSTFTPAQMAGQFYSRLEGREFDSDANANCSGYQNQKAWVDSWTAHRLGDIYHSSPVVSGPPNLFLTDPSYQQFLVDKRDRPTMIYVGANDGMIHAFYLTHPEDAGKTDPGTFTKVGTEAWAFVPRRAITSLDRRVLGQTYLMDGTFVVRDVQKPRGGTSFDVDGNGTTTAEELSQQWQTVLIANTGRAAAGFAALDVTDPERPKYMWTFTDSMLTKNYGQPAVGRVFMTCSNAYAFCSGFEGQNVERPVVLINGGYDPGDLSKGRAFYIVDLTTGQLIKRFSDDDGDSVVGDLDAPLSGSPTSYEDMPTTFTTRVFVGDLLGRMWRIDTSSLDPAAWRMARLFPAAGDTTYDTATYQKPIFRGPTVALDFGRRLIVYWGTGDVDNLDTGGTNYVYAVREVLERDSGTNTVSARGELLVDPDGDFGFPIALSESEKLLGEPIVFNGVMLFTTFRPSTSECGFGEGKLYGVDFLTGEPRLTNEGQITYASAEGAQRSISLGAGVPSAPIIRQQASTNGFDATGRPTGSPPNYQALIQKGASTSTDQVTDTTLTIDLGPLGRSADIISIVEIE